MSSLVGKRDRLNSRCDSDELAFSGPSAKEILRTALRVILGQIYEM